MRRNLKELFLWAAAIVAAVLLYFNPPWVSRSVSAVYPRWECNASRWYDEPEKVDWDVADDVLGFAAQYEHSLALEGTDQWETCSDDYLGDLKRRKEEVAAWAAVNHPVIYFMGYNHGEAEELKRDPAKKARWTIEHRTAAMFVAGNPEIDVFAFEDAGILDEPPFTVEDAVREIESKGTVRGTDGREMAAEDALPYLPQAWFKVLAARPDITVVTGEECPHWITWKVAGGALNGPLHEHSTGDSHPMHEHTCADQVALSLFNRLANLRTDVIIIRALEALRETGGDSAAILQGYAHAEDGEKRGLNLEYNVKIVAIDLMNAPIATPN